MKKIASFTLALLTLVSCQFVSYSGNGGHKVYVSEGDEITLSMDDLKDFSSIEVNGYADVNFTQADSFKVELTTNQDVVEKLDFHVKDGVLVLQTKEKVQIRKASIKVNVTAPTLSKVTVNGAADFDLDAYSGSDALNVVVNGAGDIKIENANLAELSVEVNGAGDIDLKSINVNQLSVEVNGAGDAKISGIAQVADVKISGAGDVDVRNLQCESLNTHKNGLGRIKR